MAKGGSDVSAYGPSPDASPKGEGIVVLQNLAADVRRDKGLFCRARDVARVLAALQVTGNVWEIAQRSMTPLLVVCDVLRRLVEQGYVEIEDNQRLVLTKKGERLCQDAGVPPLRPVRCRQCQGRGIDLKVLEDVREEFLRIVAERPAAIRDFDQAYMVEDASVARVVFLLGRGDLEDRELLIIGDDDLISLAAGLTRLPKRITVLEVDTRLVEFIERVSRQHDLPVEARVYNVCDPLPDDLMGRFDTFVCDPSESMGGLTAFLTRCFLGLKGEGSAGVFGLSFHEASLAKWARIQRWILDRNAVITDIIADFSQYHNWPYYKEMRAWSLLPVQTPPERPWYQSSLYRVELLDRVELVNEPFSPEIFLDEEAATF